MTPFVPARLIYRVVVHHKPGAFKESFGLRRRFVSNAGNSRDGFETILIWTEKEVSRRVQ